MAIQSTTTLHYPLSWNGKPCPCLGVRDHDFWNPDLELERRVEHHSAMRVMVGALATVISFEDMQNMPSYMGNCNREDCLQEYDASQRSCLVTNGWVMGFSFARKDYYLKTLVMRYEDQGVRFSHRRALQGGELDTRSQNPYPMMGLRSHRVKSTNLVADIWHMRDRAGDHEKVELEEVKYGRALLESIGTPAFQLGGPLKVLAGRGLLPMLEGEAPVNMGDIRSLREEALGMIHDNLGTANVLKAHDLMLAAWGLAMCDYDRREEGRAVLGPEISFHLPTDTIEHPEGRG